MLAGMFLAILLYRPIYSEFVKDTDISGYQKLTPVAVGETQVKNDIIKADSLITKTIRYTYTNGFAYTQKNVDTVFAGGVKPVAHVPAVFIDKKLPAPVYWKFVLLVFLQVVLVTMVYGPIAAFLVEMFPTKIRYTSMSLPYHIGNGVFGGLTPFIALLLTTINTGDKLVGLTYPIIVSAICFVIGALYVKNKSVSSE